MRSRPTSGERFRRLLRAIEATRDRPLLRDHVESMSSFHRIQACMRAIAHGLVDAWYQLDGIDFSEIYCQLRDDFDIQLVDADLVKAETVGDLFDVVLQALKEQHPQRFVNDPDYWHKAWDQYVDVLVDQTGLDSKWLVPTAHFLRDLKLY
jgi:acyl carrier protein